MTHPKILHFWRLLFIAPYWPNQKIKIFHFHPKMKILSLITYTSHSCHFKPIRPSFIFWTQIKIFLMKSESFLTLHRQQHNWNIQGLKGSKDSVKIVHVTSQWFNPNFMKLREYFLCAKKTKITLFNNFFSSVSVFAVRSQEYHDIFAVRSQEYHDKCVWCCCVLT